jgi:hypothetical protein
MNKLVTFAVGIFTVAPAVGIVAAEVLAHAEPAEHVERPVYSDSPVIAARMFGTAGTPQTAAAGTLSWTGGSAPTWF